MWTAGVLVCAAGTFGAVTASAGSPVKDAIIDGSQNGFLRTNFLEAGLRPNGTFGSNTSVPDGTWHPNDTGHPGQIGFRADRGKNGWGVGIDDGDYFMPGGPYEGFALRVDSTEAKNNNSTSGISGAFTSSSTSGMPTLVWASSADTGGVALEQTITLPTDGSLYLAVSVTLTNHNGAASEVYYARSVDPDNCRTRSDAVCDTNGDGVADAAGMSGWQGYRTWNKIESQRLDSDASTVIAARQTDGSLLAMATTDAESVAIMGSQEWGCGYPYGLAAAYTAARTYTVAASFSDGNTCPWANKSGEEVFADDNLALIFHRTIPAGSSSTIEFRYLLSAAEFTKFGQPAGTNVTVTASSPASQSIDVDLPAITYTTLIATSPSDWINEPTCAVYASADTGYTTPLSGPQPAGTYVTHCSGGDSVSYVAASYVDGSITVTPPDLPPTGFDPRHTTLLGLGLGALGIALSTLSRKVRRPPAA